MLNFVRHSIYKILFGKEGETMMAMLWAQKIMYAETKEEAIALYKRVPRLLKDKVEQILIESGCEDLIKESGIFTLSLLDQTCSFETIRHFGFQSGRDVDKFANITAPADENAVPYLGWQTCSVLSAKVVSRQDLGTHTLFIAEVTDAKLLSDNPPLTYADYQAHVKPKPEQKKEDKKIIGWRCKICNYVYEGSNLPEEFTCPLCGHGADDFEPIYENA